MGSYLLDVGTNMCDRIRINISSTFTSPAHQLIYLRSQYRPTSPAMGGASLEKLVGQKVILADVFCANTMKIGFLMS